MIFAIQKSDGTFRAWESAKSTMLPLPNEVRVELAEPPVFPIPPSPPRLSLELLAVKLIAKGVLTKKDVDDSKE